MDELGNLGDPLLPPPQVLWMFRRGRRVNFELGLQRPVRRKSCGHEEDDR